MRNAGKPFRPGAVLAVALIVAAAMGGIMAAVASSAHRSDEVALHQQRQLLAGALAERRLQAVLETENIATSNLAVEHAWRAFDPVWTHHNIGLRLKTLFGAAHVFVIDGADRFVYALGGNESVDPDSYGKTLGHLRDVPCGEIANGVNRLADIGGAGTTAGATSGWAARAVTA